MRYGTGFNDFSVFELFEITLTALKEADTSVILFPNIRLLNFLLLNALIDMSPLQGSVHVGEFLFPMDFAHR